MSSSPPSVSPVKRPARTYGRPKPAAETIASTSSQRVSESIPSDVSLPNGPSYAPGNIQRTFGLSNSSPIRAIENDENSDDQGSKDASPKYKWAWEAKLEEIDHQDEEEEDVNASKGTVSVPEIAEQGSKLIHHSPLSLDKDISKEYSMARDTESSFSETLPLGSVSTLASSFLESSQKTLTSSPSPSPKARAPKRVSEKYGVVDSDIDSGQEEQSKSSYPSSPVKHAINTPQERSSSTPPTSDNEDDVSAGMRKPKRKSAAVPNPLVFEPATDLDMSKAGGKKRAQPSRVKRPTIKERRETAAERQRFISEKDVSIARPQRSSKYTITNLLHSVTARKSSPFKGEDSNDPISEFSSPRLNNATVDHDSTRAKSRPDLSKELPSAVSDDDGLPGIDQLLREQRAKDLKEKKLLAIQRQKAVGTVPSGDDDDDLEVVDGPSTSMNVAMKEEAEARKSGRSAITANKRTLQQHAGISTSRRPAEATSVDQARNADQMKQILFKTVQDQNVLRIKEKNEEWVRRGGSLLESREAGEKRGVEWYAKKGLENSSKVKTEIEEEEGDEEGDEEWIPSERGSASPVPRERRGGDEDEGGSEDDFGEDQDITMVEEEGAEEDIAAQVEVPHRHSTRVVVNSDTEEEENNENAPSRGQLGNVLVPDSMIFDQNSDKLSSTPKLSHRQSDSSYDGATEDEGDKENNDRLMYDRSEDKENTAVVRHGQLGESSDSRPSLGRRQSSRFNLAEGRASRLSTSPGGGGGYSTDEDKESVRGPLQTLSVSEIEPLRLAAIPFTARLQRAASTASIADDKPEPSQTLARAPRERQASGFSQFSDDGEGAQPKKLEAGFSDFLDESQKPSTSRPAFGTIKEPTQSNNFFAKLRKNDSLGLTQDVGLQPALAVDENLKRRADQVFEKEQAFLLEAVNQSTDKQPELYINSEGFLTQTRPAEDAEIYRPMATPSQAYSQNGRFSTQIPTPSFDRRPSQAYSQNGPFSTQIPTPSLDRRPFRELSTSFDLPEDTPSNRPRRLTKRRSSSPLGTMVPSKLTERASSPPPPSPSYRPKHTDRAKLDKPRRRQERSEFVEEEAQESDEDEEFGFTKTKEADEEDGEDQDRTLETLVDDKEMDHAEVAEDRVMEKYQEHVQADDARVEEIANLAVQGEFRYGKRRKRTGVEASDDEDEEDEKNSRIRKKMRAPEIRGDIRSLAEREDTRAFAEHYQAGIKDDEHPELAYLHDGNDAEMREASYDGQQDEDVENQDDYVDPGEIRRLAREAAQNKTDEKETVFDPNNTSFIDGMDDEDEDMPRVRAAQQQPSRRVAVARNADEFDMDASQSYRSASMLDEAGRSRAEAFVKSEQRLQKLGSRPARNGGGITVMGHPKAAHAKTGVATRGGNEKKPQAVKAVPSMLNAVNRKFQ